MQVPQKINSIRQYLYDQCHPTLTKTNAIIKTHLDTLPKVLSPNWDKSLENKEITLTVNIHSKETLDSIAKTLNETGTIKAIDNALGQL